ncbi:MAG: GNAT family N-acetyltransferase [Proteobacteria bacterium]|nr:GNAT family N-acetyltransferase [Pseudomonadota bacterium]
MTPGPTLTTPRLILRPPSQQDFAGFAAMSQEPETMRFIGGVQPPDAAWRGLACMAGSWQLLGFSMFSVLRRDTGEWIGRLGPWHPGGAEGSWPGDEIGWALRANAMGQGFAQEGAAAAMDWAFDHLGWESLIHSIDSANVASIRLAQRLGSELQRRQHRMPAPFQDVCCDIYGQTRAQWRARQRGPGIL